MTTTETKTTERIARIVKVYEFTKVDSDGYACYDERIVEACYLSDRPTTV